MEHKVAVKTLKGLTFGHNPLDRNASLIEYFFEKEVTREKDGKQKVQRNISEKWKLKLKKTKVHFPH